MDECLFSSIQVAPLYLDAAMSLLDRILEKLLQEYPHEEAIAFTLVHLKVLKKIS